MKRTVLPACLLALFAWGALRPPAAAAVPAGVPLAWGKNDHSQLGDGTFTSSAVPLPMANLTNIVAVSGGEYHSLALKADGTVRTWGGNDHGQLGNGTFTDSTVPVPVSNLSGVIGIGGAGNCSLVLKTDGTVWAWGDNAYGQLGIGTFGGTRTTPVSVANLSGVVAIKPSGQFSLALKADGTVWAWGLNQDGQLGDGTFTNRSSPVRVANLPGVSALAVGSRHSLALAADGRVWAWGHNYYGQLGNGTFTLDPPYGIATPGPVANLSGVVAIGDGYGWTEALKADGTVWTWGRNQSGQLGQGTFTPDPGVNLPAPVVGPDGTGVLDGVLAIEGRAQTRAVRSDGSVWAWGQNWDGQLGNGTTNPDPPYGSATPVQVLGPQGSGFLAGPLALGGGHYHNLAVDLAAEYFVALQPPVNVDGTSVFKKSSTVEVRFKLTGASAGITDAQARFGYAQIDSSSPGAVNESVSNAAATPGILFQYDAASGEYRYNWRTTGLGMGFYRLRIDLGDGVTRTVVVGLK